MILLPISAFISAVTSSAYVFDNTGSFSYSDYSGAYYIEFSGKHAYIEQFSSVDRSSELNLDYRINAACGFGGRVLFLCDDTPNNQLVIYTYSISGDILDSFCIYGAKLYNNTDFCCDETGFYIESNNSDELKKYSFNGTHVDTYSFNSDITYAACGYSSGIIAISDNTMYRINNDSFIRLSGDEISAPIFAANDRYYVSAFGDVYSVTDSVEYLFRLSSDGQTNGACVIGETLYSPYRSTVYGYDKNTGEKLCYYNAGRNPSLLYARGNNMAAVEQRGTSFYLNTNDFTKISKESDNNTYNSTYNTINTNTEHNKSEISSNVYNVSFDDMIISKIPSGTTVAEFKSNINHEGYEIKVYRGESEKKSGNVGTVMTAVFTSELNSYTFELSVIGDLTGEGSVNSRDLNLLMDYLIGSADFNGAYSVSADISNDGSVDVIDLAALKRLI